MRMIETVVALRLHAPSSPPGGDVHHHHFLHKGLDLRALEGWGHQGAPGRTYSWWAGAGLVLRPGEGEVAVQLGRGPAQAAVRQPLHSRLSLGNSAGSAAPPSWDRPPRPRLPGGLPRSHASVSSYPWPKRMACSVAPIPGMVPRKVHISVSRWTSHQPWDCGHN